MIQSTNMADCCCWRWLSHESVAHTNIAFMLMDKLRLNEKSICSSIIYEVFSASIFSLRNCIMKLPFCQRWPAAEPNSARPSPDLELSRAYVSRARRFPQFSCHFFKDMLEFYRFYSLRRHCRCCGRCFLLEFFSKTSFGVDFWLRCFRITPKSMNSSSNNVLLTSKSSCFISCFHPRHPENASFISNVMHNELLDKSRSNNKSQKV